ncbi:MAG: hypothetical protein K9J30_11490 [Bacteroidales bacterium]|nr:hypothetical protein [Bacteroidales bacterium]
MRRTMITYLLASSVLVFSQKPGFKEVDTTTYNQFLRGEWKNLISSGKNALDHGYDYYYLQMRLAYAHFALNHYRQSIIYYKNALSHSSNDPVANEYLYYCYKYSGRNLDAIVHSRSLTSAQNNQMNVKNKGIISLGADHSLAFSNAEEIRDNITSGIDPFREGVQKATYSMNSTAFNLSHTIGKTAIMEYRVTHMNKTEYSYFIDNTVSYLSTEQSINQTEYSLDVKIALTEGLSVKPGLHFIQTAIPLYDLNSYGFNPAQNKTELGKLTVRSLVPKVMIEKKTTYVDIGVSYAYIDFNNITANQAGLHATVFPFGNLNLYITSDTYFQFAAHEGNSEFNLLFKPMAGIKVHDNFWIELGAGFPDQFNFYDMKNKTAYNNIEKISRGLSVNMIFPVYKLPGKVFINYQHLSVDSYFFPADNQLDPFNMNSYTTHLITGGISWTR